MFKPNILIDPLPTEVEVSGRMLPIVTGFRTGMVAELMMQSGDLTEQEMLKGILRLYYDDATLRELSKVEHPEEAFRAALWFYSCGKPEEKPDTNKSKKPGFSARIYDFEVDAQLIYSAFLTQYRIDLADIEDMHWWKFVALFTGLDESHRFSKIIGYRTVNLAEIKDKKQKRQMAELQAKYALPDHRSKEEKVAAIGAVFGGFR